MSDKKSKKTVLWIVNMIMPDLAEHLGVRTGSSGTWMIDLSRRLVDYENCNLVIACIYGKTLKKYDVKGITYYTVPGTSKNMYFYTSRFETIWREICKEVLPDLVHLHGTEYSHGLSFLRACPDVPALLTIQGIMCKISNADFGGITKREAFFLNTLREWLHFSGMYMNNLLRIKNLKYEREIIQRVKYVTGRTEWDKAVVKSINPNINYFRVFYNLRDEFYSCGKWDIDSIQRQTIYASTSAQVALKGGHILLKALALVKFRYPHVRVYFLLNNAKEGKFVVNNGYGYIIKKLLRKYDLYNNVEFIPPQNAKGVIDYMKRCHCTVIPSAMENASATLREAMHLGVPCIVAYRGGMAEMIDENVDGFLYDFTEYEVLADKICKLFENDENLRNISINAIRKAELWHDRNKNPQDMDEVYRAILENEES